MKANEQTCARNAKKMNARRKNLRGDRSGGLEGLPLYLIILVVIAASSVGIITMWMGQMDDEGVQSISDIETTIKVGNSESYKDYIDISRDSRETIRVIVKVFDQDGNKMDNIAVTLSGAGVKTTSKVITGESTTFTVDPDLPDGVASDFIRVSVDGPDGLHKTTSILVKE